MLERETELIKQIILASTINGRDAIRISEVIAADVPRGVKSFMLGQVTALLEDDVKGTARLAQITKDIAPTITSERSLLRSFAVEYVLARDEYLKLVEDTVHFLENYLCRPQWTLTQFVFEKREEISLQELVYKFDLVADYAYYGTLTERYMRRKGLSSITTGDFQSLIGRIDAEVLKQHSPRELALMTKPIYDFLLFGDVTMNRPVPLGAVLLFFEDKKAFNVKEYIERICYVRARKQISMNELIGIVEDLYQVETTVKTEVAKSEQEILSLSQPQEQTRNAQQEATPIEPQSFTPDEGSAEMNLQIAEETTQTPDVQLEKPANNVLEMDANQLAHDIPHLEVVPPPIINADALAEYAVAREAQRHALFLTFPENHPAPVAPASATAVEETLTDAQREEFIAKVFDNDANAFAIFMASISKARSWRDAQVHLRELFEMNKLDILSPDVVAFTDAMHAYYEPALKKIE